MAKFPGRYLIISVVASGALRPMPPDSLFIDHHRRCNMSYLPAMPFLFLAGIFVPVQHIY